MVTANPQKKRPALWSLVFLLGIFISLPIPTSNVPLHAKILVTSLWIILCCLLWARAFKKDWENFFWILAVVVSLVGLLKAQVYLVFPLLVLWKIWNIKVAERLKTFAMVLHFATVPTVFSQEAMVPKSEVLGSKPGTTAIEASIPKYLSGYELRDLINCGVLDRIPWKFKPDGRKTRLILRDSLRHQNEAKFVEWEAHQIMDSDGYVAVIFRRNLASGRKESIILKDTVYQKIIDTPKGQKIVENQDLRSLVNRPALVLYHSNGGSITYSPSSVGRSALVMQMGTGSGRMIAPIFLRGNYCDRPDDEENSDAQNKKSIQATNPAAANGAAASGAP